MPGTYPRSSNPYFPFDRMDQIERDLHLFQDLTYSHNYKAWALSTVFSTFSSAFYAAKTLNLNLTPGAGGHYVVVPANQTLVWCRSSSIGIYDDISPKVVSWSAPVASAGWIIVWQSDNTTVLTETEYIEKFHSAPYLDPAKQNIWPGPYQHEYPGPRNLVDKGFEKLSSAPEYEYKPVKPLPMIERCPVCGEPVAFCRCEQTF